MSKHNFSYTIKNNLVLFWNGPFSQWFLRDFNVPYYLFDLAIRDPKIRLEYQKKYQPEDICAPLNYRFNCAEQAMMFGKAVVFGDFETADSILAAELPREQKMLGRKVKNFDPVEWEAVCDGLVTLNNVQKFSQHADLKEFLTKDCARYIIVEASPMDKIWGIGLDESDPRAWDIATWQGENKLGNALMSARDFIIHRDRVQADQARKFSDVDPFEGVEED